MNQELNPNRITSWAAMVRQGRVACNCIGYVRLAAEH
jgi:hypothetical protein